MDRYLINYLNSGKAWVLVGTGPSLQMGYPSWEDLARRTVPWIKSELPSTDTRGVEGALNRRDWPAVFGEASHLLGSQTRLLQFMEGQLKPSGGQGEIYDLLARWPVPVYLTTNWDDEIQRHLTKLGETYIPYTNSADHMARLIPDLQGAVFKLHGELRSTAGLVMTSAEYDAIATKAEWEHWRVKMNAVFQMSRVVVVGHSLADPHIRHVLSAARKGAGIEQPVVWIAPNAADDVRREMLLQHRIRVVSYHDRDGRHADLLQLLRDVTRFVVPRERISIHLDLARALPSVSQSESAAAAALLVYSAFVESDPIEKKRTKLIVAALESAVPNLATEPPFTLTEGLSAAGWPDECPLSGDSMAEVAREAETQGVLARAGGDRFTVPSNAVDTARRHIAAYTHLRERFQRAVAQRVIRLFPLVVPSEAASLAADIERTLVGCFRADGFAVASSTFGTQTTRERTLPASILDFVNSASAQYPDLLHRRAFFSSTVDALVNATSAESEYLGALAGGYCAFNYLGVYGDVAIQRFQHAKESVWLVDSDVQIPALALAAPTHVAFSSCLERLRNGGVRLFTLDSLFEETYRHYWFARGVIDRYGPASQDVLYAAQGQPPYRKTNQFLEGFVRWQSAGNGADWESYLALAFGARNPDRGAIRSKLESLGVTVVEFQDWPGFDQTLFEERDRLTQDVVNLRLPSLDQDEGGGGASDLSDDPQRKAKPEAEAIIVIRGERAGQFHVLSSSPSQSDGWFISHTTILNTLEHGGRLTWRPESFVRFTEGLSTAGGSSEAGRADRFFQSLLWSVSQSGMSVLDEKSVEAVFGSVADQSVLTVARQREHYSRVLVGKYGVAPDEVLRRVRRADQPLAALQLANELAVAEKARADVAVQEAEELRRRLKKADQELERVDRYRKRIAQRARKSKKKARQDASRPVGKKKGR